MIVHLPEKCMWFPFSDEPLISSLKYAPRFCDPQFLMPEESCDRRWHMFFHSWIGIHHFISDSGIAWEPCKLIVDGGHSPSIFYEDGVYYLVYEKHRLPIDYFSKPSKNITLKYSSRIEMIQSSDLMNWSKPTVVLTADSIPYSKDYLKYYKVSRPHIIKVDNVYRMYFGASHLLLPDTKQKVSRYFGFAESSSIEGPYEVGNGMKPILEPIPDSKESNLGCGAVRVVKVDDVFYAFQCGVYWDPVKKTTHSSMIILKSYDGINFSQCVHSPVLNPTTDGWASSYIKSCDVHYRESEDCWYCYFSANGSTRNGLFKDESIGLVIGSMNGLKADK